MLHYYRIALLQDIRSRTATQKSDSRSARAANITFYVYVVFVACYLPFYSVRFAMKIVGETILLQQLKFFHLRLFFLIHLSIH